MHRRCTQTLPFHTLRTSILHCLWRDQCCRCLSVSNIRYKKERRQKSLRKKVLGYMTLAYVQFPLLESWLQSNFTFQLENINVYKQMSIADLATTLNKSVDHVFECLSYIPTNSKQRQAQDKQSILDFDVIREVCMKSGVRATLISQSASDKKAESNGLFLLNQFVCHLVSLPGSCHTISSWCGCLSPTRTRSSSL